MATKFHISSSGKPVACRASKNPYPLGAWSPHFTTREEAEAYLEKRNEERAAELEATIQEIELRAAYFFF